MGVAGLRKFCGCLYYRWIELIGHCMNRQKFVRVEIRRACLKDYRVIFVGPAIIVDVADVDPVFANGKGDGFQSLGAAGSK